MLASATLAFDARPEELFVLGGLCGYENVVSVDCDIAAGPRALRRQFESVCASLRKRGWLREDFDGNVALAQEMVTAAELVCAPDFFWLLQFFSTRAASAPLPANLYYKNGNYLLLRQASPAFQCTVHSDTHFMGAFLAECLSVPDSAQTESLTVDEMVGLAKQQPYTMASAAGYALTADGVVCHTATTIITLSENGAYLLSPGAEGDRFTPCGKAACIAHSETVFQVEGALHE